MYKNKILMRELFLRNTGFCDSEYNMPVIYKEDIDLQNVKLIGCHNIKKNDTRHSDFGVHFYKWDCKLERFYNQPFKYLDVLRQYKFVLTPDFSLFLNMNINVQKMNVFRNRWCGNFWQRNGLCVIPSAGWGGKETFSWCNAGLPQNILCYGKVHAEMLGTAKIIPCIHEAQIIKHEVEFELERKLYPHSLFDMEVLKHEC